MTPILTMLPAMVLAFFCIVDVAVATTIEIGEGNLIKDLGRTAYTLIYFYSDTCGYCQAFDSDFENLSLLFNDQDNTNLQITKVNGAKNNHLSKLFNVNQYPTISLLEFSPKKIVKYSGNRDLPSLIDFLQDYTKETPNYSNFASKLTTLTNANYQTHLNRRLIVFVADYLPQWNNYRLPTHFIHQINDVDVGIVDLQDDVHEILAHYQLSQFPVMAYFENEKNFKKSLVDVLDKDNVRKFIDSISNPTDWIYDYTYTPPIVSSGDYDYDYEDEDDYSCGHHDEL